MEHSVQLNQIMSGVKGKNARTQGGGAATTKGARTALSASPCQQVKNTRTRLSALLENLRGARRFGQIAAQGGEPPKSFWRLP